MKKIKLWLLMAIVLPTAAFVSCGDKNGESDTELRTTIYVFGPDYMSEIRPTTNIAKDGQYPTVGKIKIVSDGENARGSSSYNVLENVLDPAFSAANGKGTGDNSVLNGIRFQRNPDGTKTEAAIADSLKLVRDYHFVIQNAR
jgi:hypothetical protein